MRLSLFIRSAIAQLPCAIVLISVSAFSQPIRRSETSASPPTKTRSIKQSAQSADEGDRIFQQQCSRCHNAPESFSPRISGTIVRHMRIRASLSQHEEKELLRFVNP